MNTFNLKCLTSLKKLNDGNFLQGFLMLSLEKCKLNLCRNDIIYNFSKNLRKPLFLAQLVHNSERLPFNQFS